MTKDQRLLKVKQMAGALNILLTLCLLHGVLSADFQISLPETIEAVAGSSVTISCSFEIQDEYEQGLDDTCVAMWRKGNYDDPESDISSRFTTTATTEDLKNKTCTSTINNIQIADSGTYFFRVQCNNPTIYTYPSGVNIKVKGADFQIFLPDTIEAVAGSCVTIPCSFEIQDEYEQGLDDTCVAMWRKEDHRNPESDVTSRFTTTATTEDLKNKTCTSTINNIQIADSGTYFFRVQCNNPTIYTYPSGVNIKVKGADFQIFLPDTIEAVAGSCVTIPCSFEIQDEYEQGLDDTCVAMWRKEDHRNPESDVTSGFTTTATTEDLKNKTCTSTINNIQIADTGTYFFRVQCDNPTIYTYPSGVNISVKGDPPRPTLSPSELEVEEGASVSLQCSAPAPCPSLPPTVTWTPSLGTSQETLMDNQDKTKVIKSVLKFTASHLHHGQRFSCTADYRREDNRVVSSVNQGWTAHVKYRPKNTTVLVSPSGPVQEGTNVLLKCSSDANPAVQIYTWYRADPQHETLIHAGPDLTITASRNTGAFLCQAENELGTGRSNKTNIDVQYVPKETKVLVSPSGPVQEGTNVLLKCSSDANPAVQIYTWYRADPQHETLIHTGPDLTITASRNTGAFLCQAQNDLGTGRSNKTNIDVQYVPKETKVLVSPSGPVQEGTNVFLKCSSDANPAVKIYTWYRADPEHETLIHTGPDLTITTSRNTGAFLCQAQNDLGTGRSNKTNIDVQYVPKETKVLVSPSGPVQEGTNVLLKCSSDANPAVQIYTWYRADPQHETLIHTGPDLTITASRNTGAFLCQAQNDLGTGRSNKTNIDVQYVPKETKVLVSPSGPVQEGTNVVLKCSSDANPAVQIYTWYRADPEHETLIHTGPDLTITASRNTGAFLCQAQNDLGTGRSNKTNIDVQYVPKETKVLVSPSGPVQEGTNVLLKCSSDANPAVKIYTWYRADPQHETLIHTGPDLTITASRNTGAFLCQAQNDLGTGRSNKTNIHVQYVPKDFKVLVSPSGPVEEGTNVVLKCSSDANPAVQIYTWYRADPQHETLIHTGPDLTITASRNTGAFLCQAQNDLGTGRSNRTDIDVQFAPQILSPSNCTKAAATVSCSCSTVGNPSPRLQWYLDGLSVNHSDKVDISSESLNGTGLRSTITINLPQKLDLSTLLCHSRNSVGSTVGQFYFYTFEQQTPAVGQGQGMFPALITTVSALLILVCGLLFAIRTMKTRLTRPSTGTMYQHLDGNDEVLL
ncbi:B-cell receptor CD22-like isoform X2 [Sphaeramia orbicularis]|uniref:B-cell receptor CD22-like isoform X2 n=1 Tax=Sphaeramia orbicularis TaxID=375764 RepID=UPI0011802AB0|nr:B-cell receptor CD22-like isoform X2 [Sphaeramia orbicularis]